MATTYNNLYLDTRNRLRKAGISAAQIEAREIVCYASDKTREHRRDGIRGIPALLSSNIHEGTWPELINGGVFGLEGGLAVTAVLAVACAVVLFVPTKKSEIVENI